jgi:hypothetical protein
LLSLLRSQMLLRVLSRLLVLLRVLLLFSFAQR